VLRVDELFVAIVTVKLLVMLFYLAGPRSCTVVYDYYLEKQKVQSMNQVCLIYMCLLVFGIILADPDPYPFQPNVKINYTFSRKFKFTVEKYHTF
jgi:hypothetical protein